MEYLYNRLKSRWQGSGVGTNSGVTVTKTAPSDANRQYVVIGIQCSGDAAALVTIESPASTVLYRKRFAGAFTLSENFGNAPLQGAVGQAALVKISASSSNCEANIQGGVV